MTKRMFNPFWLTCWNRLATSRSTKVIQRMQTHCSGLKQSDLSKEVTKSFLPSKFQGTQKLHSQWARLCLRTIGSSHKSGWWLNKSMKFYATSSATIICHQWAPNRNSNSSNSKKKSRIWPNELCSKMCCRWREHPLELARRPRTSTLSTIWTCCDS